MNYEIQNKNDFLTGSYIVVKIPENELDQCALYTIQSEHPDFILPFHYKSSDGQIEFVYKVGTLCKLQYFSGELTPKEYADLWQSLLKPLLECADWFMNPCSFLLNVDHLYYDKNKKAIRYIYVPSAYGCSGYDAFFEMAVEISKMVTVSDSTLENKVLRAIIKDFNPVEFLQMLKDHVTECTTYSDVAPVLEYHDLPESSVIENKSTDESIIEIMPEIDIVKRIKMREASGFKLFGRRSKRKKTPYTGFLTESSLISLPERSVIDTDLEEFYRFPVSDKEKQLEVIDITNITQSTSIISEGPGLKYVGYAHLPPSIQIILSEGEMFTIGRFDAAVGKKQSDFEFDKKTRAVSRRHAVIERDIDGYKIVDLSSSAGTFINNKKLPPNTPHGLETGCRVSFGNSGADYVWDVS